MDTIEYVLKFLGEVILYAGCVFKK